MGEDTTRVTLDWEQVLELVRTASAGKQELGKLQQQILSCIEDNAANGRLISDVDTILRGTRGDNGFSARLHELEREVRFWKKAVAWGGGILSSAITVLIIELMKRTVLQ